MNINFVQQDNDASWLNSPWYLLIIPTPLEARRAPHDSWWFSGLPLKTATLLSPPTTDRILTSAKEEPIHIILYLRRLGYYNDGLELTIKRQKTSFLIQKRSSRNHTHK